MRTKFRLELTRQLIHEQLQCRRLAQRARHDWGINWARDNQPAVARRVFYSAEITKLRVAEPYFEQVTFLLPQSLRADCTTWVLHSLYPGSLSECTDMKSVAYMILRLPMDLYLGH